MSDQQLAEELHKLIIRKFNKSKVEPSFIDNIWDADLADMQLMSKFNKRVRVLSYVIDFIANMVMLFLWKIKMVLQLLMLCKKLEKNII